MSMSATSQQASGFRWVMLVLGIVCMTMIANLQYGWTLFVGPMDDKYHWGRAAIQVAFSIFVLTETWLVPIEGWFVDRFGPKIVVLVGGVLCGIAWAMNAYASSLGMLYAAAAIGGIGAGAVYGTAFLYFGIGQGIVVVVLSLFLRAPREGEAPAPKTTTLLQTKRQYTPIEIVQSPIFWVMYLMFVLVGAGGLMATAQLAPIAKDFKVDTIPVSMIGITLPALTFALSLDRILNGLTRPFFGWVSDNIGRENTMFIAFGIEAIGIWMLAQFGQDPLAFVILSGLVFFAWGEIYSLFPSTCTDTYGVKYATTNAGLLYTAKGTASLLVPFGNVLATYTGNRHAVFVVAAIMNLVASLAALVVLKPMRAAHNASVAATGAMHAAE